LPAISGRLLSLMRNGSRPHHFCCISKYGTLAGKVLGSERANGLKDMVFNLEKVGDIRELARRLMLAKKP
jgi:hypothetical protein